MTRKKMNLTCSCGHWHNFTTDEDGDGDFKNYECDHFTAYVKCKKHWWHITIICKKCTDSGKFLCFSHYKCCGHSLTRTTTDA